MMKPLRTLTLLLTGLSGMLALGTVTPVAAADQSGDRAAYVLFSAGDGGSTMSGTTDDFRAARAMRSGREAMLYVRRGDATYVIRDAATLDQGERIFAPQRALGARQSELGARQSELGRRQSALGAEQARLGQQMADDPQRATRLGRQMAALGREQATFGAQQSELGAQQSELGREQARLARLAEGEFRVVVDEAIERGVAQRVN